MRTIAFAQFHREPRSMRVLKWIVGPLLAVHIVLATISGYRAIVQVYRVELAVKWIPDHHIPSYDPRTIHASGNVTVTADHLAHFDVGPAILRVTGNGKSQWLRVPPPRVRDVPVRIGE